MGQSDFLTLFTTQLKNQNPLDPVKNEAFVAQLAQFSQLEATTAMKTSMETMVKSLDGDKMLAGAALIAAEAFSGPRAPAAAGGGAAA
jgi:flagellar basal-body rod modification protein FlgD